jgi:hypothetical protein
MYYRIQDTQITATYPANTQSVYLPEIDEHVQKIAFEAHGIFKLTRQSVALLENEYITGYELQVINGKPVEVPVIAEKTAEMLQAELESWRATASLSNAAARRALILTGKMSLIDTLLNALPEPEQTLAKSDWEYETVIHRSHPMVQGLVTAGIFTDVELDSLFRAA